MNLAVILACWGASASPEKTSGRILRETNAYSIGVALESGGSRLGVIVSTDDEEVASIARSLGAETPFLDRRSFQTTTPQRCYDPPRRGLGLRNVGSVEYGLLPYAITSSAPSLSGRSSGAQV
ncbi:MAG: hypothetical protein R3F11_07925 [Verrucomicrobiales bacterium]